MNPYTIVIASNVWHGMNRKLKNLERQRELLLKALKKNHLVDEDGVFNGECPMAGHVKCDDCELITKAEAL